ncbi:hypothetical protein BDW66DRAFT_129977 [Aspergillus desertorum]
MFFLVTLPSAKPRSIISKCIFKPLPGSCLQMRFPTPIRRQGIQAPMLQHVLLAKGVWTDPGPSSERVWSTLPLVNQQSSPRWSSLSDSGPDVPLHRSGLEGCVPLYKPPLGPDRVSRANSSQTGVMTTQSRLIKTP